MNRICWLLGIFSLSIQPVAAQGIGGLMKKVKKAAAKVTSSLSWEPGNAVSTSLKDTLPGFYWLNDYLAGLEPDTIKSFELLPGYYHATIRSYCLHAGTYGPSKGAGYQMANFQGTQRALIKSILEKSVNHPAIPQRDVQTLIWGIEAGQKFSDYATDFQLRVKPLLTAREMALMEVDVDNLIGKMMPQQVEGLLNTYSSMREQMQSAQMQYDRLEEIAVKTGIPPIGAGSVTINPGKWSYLKSGYFIKADPRGYPTTEITLYRPAPVEVSYDQQNRISSYHYNGNEVQINYKNKGTEFRIGNHTAHKQALESFTLTNQNGEQITVPTDVDYIDLGADVTHDVLQGAKDWDLGDVVKKNTNLDLNELQHALDKIETAKGAIDNLNQYREDLKNYPPDNLDKYINETAINETINEGLKAALNPIDKKGQNDWIRDHLRMVMDFYFYSICKLRGDDCQSDDQPRKPGLPDYVAQPGNTNAQRLGLSEIKK